MSRGIINRRASKKVTSYYRDNRAMNARLRSERELEANSAEKNDKNEGGKNNVK